MNYSITLLQIHCQRSCYRTFIWIQISFKWTSTVFLLLFWFLLTQENWNFNVSNCFIDKVRFSTKFWIFLYVVAAYKVIMTEHMTPYDSDSDIYIEVINSIQQVQVSLSHVDLVKWWGPMVKWSFKGFFLSPFWPLGFSADKEDDTLEAQSVHQDKTKPSRTEGGGL